MKRFFARRAAAEKRDVPRLEVLQPHRVLPLLHPLLGTATSRLPDHRRGTTVFFRALSFLQALFVFLVLWVVAPSCVARFAQLHDFLVGPFLGALSCRAGFCALQRPLGAGSSALPLSSSAALLDVLHVPRCFWIHSLFLNAVIRASRLFLPCFSCVSGVRDAQKVCGRTLCVRGRKAHRGA